jgi:magnesium-transporting ATPase (P-type)
MMKDNIVEVYKNKKFVPIRMSEIEKGNVIRFLDKNNEPEGALYLAKEDSKIMNDSYGVIVDKFPIGYSI